MTNQPGKTGKIYLVGIGPGDAEYLAPAANNALAKSDVIVGFRAYIEQIDGLIAGKDVVSMELGQELERAAAAVDSAYAGKDRGRCVFRRRRYLWHVRPGFPGAH